MQVERTAALIVALACLAIVGCGGKDLSSQILTAETHYTTFCAEGGPGGGSAVHELTALLRKYGNVKTPEELNGPKRPLKSWIADAANYLDGCGDAGQEYARQLDRVLKNG